MDRLRILQIFARYLQYGGEEGSVGRIADALRGEHDVHYFSVSTEDIMKGGEFSKLLLPFLALHNAPAARQLRELHLRERFDFWQIHNVFPAISPAAYKMAFDLEIPVIHYLHNYKFGCPNGFLFANGRENRDCIHGNYWPAIRDKTWHDSYIKTAVMSAVLTYARSLGVLQNVTRWIALSQAQKAICTEMGIPAERIAVLPHFLESEGKDAPPIPQNGYGLFIGRLSAEKGVSRLIQAWAGLSKSRKLVIVGDGPEMPALRKLADQLGLHNVDFRGFVPRSDHAALWAGAAFSIVPSIWQEPFGMVVLEAWANGRPVIGHCIGAIPEIIRDRENGFLADVDSTDDLTTTLEAAFSMDPQGLEDLARAGMHDLRTVYSKQRWLRGIREIYQGAGLTRRD